jgi:hypothetical protein
VDCDAGGRRARLGLQGLGLRQDVVARACTGNDEPLVFQQVVGGKHRGRTDLATGAGLAHRGQAVTGAQGLGPDQVGNFLGVAFITFHGN